MFKERKDVLFKGLLTLFGGIVLLNTIKTNRLLKSEIDARTTKGAVIGSGGLGRAIAFNDAEKGETRRNKSRTANQNKLA